jgi:cbb3-type cytochrome c oxidase subunit III
MKTKSAFPIALLFVNIAVAIACSRATPDNSNVDKKLYNSTGVIMAIDTNALKVTINHQDIPGYMSAMEMTFSAADKSVIEGLAVGDNVAFNLERTGMKVTLTKITKTTPTAATVDGSQVFASNCSECHGAKGEGSKKGIPLISGHALGHTEMEYIEQVNNGKTGKMPAFHEKLSAEQVAAVVKYVRSELQAGVTDEQRKEHHH